MTVTLATEGRRTSPALRLELIALLIATCVVVVGVVLTQEARLHRASLQGETAVRTAADVRTTVARSLALVLITFYLVHAFRRWRAYAGDGLLVPSVLMLSGVGLMAMLTVRDPLREPLLVVPFAQGVCLGGAAALAAMAIDYERLRSFAYLPLAGAVLLSVVLIVFGGGPGRSGVKVNLWGAQPVEIIRLLEIAFLAAYLGSRWEYLRSLQDPDVGRTRVMRALHIPPLDYLLPLLLGVAATLAFYVAQRDLGPALIMGCVFLAMYAVASRRAGLALAGLACVLAAFWLGYQVGIPSTVRSRVGIWLSPWENGLRGGDQVAHGLWALATGGLVGSGPGLGDAPVVPAAHTDLVLAVVGEELGFVGILAVLLLYAVIVSRAFHIALRARGDYSFFLALGIALALVIQLLLIAGGVLAVVPLSGVVTPFLSYGKSSMVVSCIAIGVLLSIADRRTRAPAAAFHVPVRALALVLVAVGITLVARAFQVQVVTAREIMARPVLTVLGDGSYRFQDNPRLLAAARDLIPRGRILDRHGSPLAFTGTCGETVGRCYPLGGVTYHLLGDLKTERDWAASNTSFLERDQAPRLRGFDDHAVRVTLPRRDGNGSLVLLRRDYSELIGLARHRYDPDHPEVRRLVAKARDLRTTIDARLQVGIGNLLRVRLDRVGQQRSAVIVLDVATREVLASVSYPWPDLEGGVFPPDASLDRVRYGLYPPGSAFKLVTSVAALTRSSTFAERAFMCERLPDGANGHRIPGWSRPVRDDVADALPHGRLTLTQALTVSCNAYFAQLGVALGPDALRKTARDFDISVAAQDAPARLRDTLPFAAIGQGEVVTTPARLAQVVATIAGGGMLAPLRWIQHPETSKVPARRLMPRATADTLARAMRGVVTAGTGRVVNANATPIAGKTGTAEVDGQPSHSWFAGLAPFRTTGRQLAFVVLVENGGYGARTAAPIASAIVDLARQLRIIE